MKKHIKVAICIFSIFILFIVGVCLTNLICIEVSTLKFEQKYKNTKSDTDLINLVVSLQNSCRNKAKIQYAQELLNSITEEGIRSSNLSKTEYINLLDTVSPKEIAIDLYFYTLLYAREYELYVSEFAELYPQLSYKMQNIVNALVPDIYGETEDVQVLNTGISAYLKVVETETDEILKEECICQADILKELRHDISNE